MSLENRRFRLGKGDLQHLPRKFVLAARFLPRGCVEISFCSAIP